MRNNFNAEAALEQLLVHKAEFEAEIGQPVAWNPNPDTSDKIVGLYRDALTPFKHRAGHPRPKPIVRTIVTFDRSTPYETFGPPSPSHAQQAWVEARATKALRGGAERLNDARHEQIASGLVDRGFVVVPRFLGRESVTALRGEGARRRTAGEFHAASVGRAGNAERHASIRGDSICWLGGRASTAPECALLVRLRALSVALNGGLFLGIAEVEAHYACYPPGASYLRHVDRFRDDAARVISLVLYLNDDWRDADGGALRIYATRDAREPVYELPPRGGTLVAMRSEMIPHEVLPASAERWSIAGWLRRRPREFELGEKGKVDENQRGSLD